MWNRLDLVRGDRGDSVDDHAIPLPDATPRRPGGVSARLQLRILR